MTNFEGYAQHFGMERKKSDYTTPNQYIRGQKARLIGVLYNTVPLPEKLEKSDAERMLFPTDPGRFLAELGVCFRRVDLANHQSTWKNKSEEDKVLEASLSFGEIVYGANKWLASERSSREARENLRRLAEQSAAEEFEGAEIIPFPRRAPVEDIHVGVQARIEAWRQEIAQDPDFGKEPDYAAAS